MAGSASFRDLIAWQKGMVLAERCYHIARELPASERFALGGQLRRAGVSVPANIAEGQRLTPAAFRAHLRLALGSGAEIETHVELARRLGFISSATAEQLILDAQEVSRLLRGLIASLPR